MYRVFGETSQRVSLNAECSREKGSQMVHVAYPLEKQGGGVCVLCP